MTKKRIITIVNIFLSVAIIASIFLPIIHGKSLFNSSELIKYIVLILSILTIVVNILNEKVEYGFICTGFVTFYLLQLGWGTFNILEYGYYIMFISSIVLMILTIVYGFLDEKKEEKRNVHSQIVANNVMNGYPYGNGQGNVQMPYQNQMVYRNGQMYNNYNRR